MCRRNPDESIAVPEADIGWLVDWRDRVAQGETFHHEPTGGSAAEAEDVCERWTRVVACNLILDLVPFFHAVLARDSDNFLQGISYADLDDWLAAGAIPPTDGEALQGEAACAEWQAGDPEHVWRRINRWLALEAMLRHIQGVRGPGPVSVSLHAERTFTEPFPAVALDPPPVCRRRSAAVLEAYRHWFDSLANCLADLVRSTLLPDRDNFAEDEEGVQLTEALQECLELSPLTALVKLKNQQLTTCVGRLNREQSDYRVEAGWLANISGRVFAAWRQRQDFWWGRWWDRYTGNFLGRVTGPGRDCGNLTQLVQWLRTHPDAPAALGGPVSDTRLARIAADCPCRVHREQLGELLMELELVGRLVRQRGLPADWGETMQVCDLFFHPLSARAVPAPGVRSGGPPPGFDFGLWYADCVRS